MSSQQKLKYFLTHRLRISNKETSELILSGKIKINGKIISENSLISEWDEIICDEKIIQKGNQKLYFLFNKPRRIECTMNAEIPDNILKFIPENSGIFHVGRLDKESEGLLILTNDGSISRKILAEETEKEYEVSVVPYPENQTGVNGIDAAFKEKMENGVKIMGTITKPCKLKILSAETFNITLTEGKNRQIRRMCHKLQFKVTTLKRLRIGNLFLEDLAPGQIKKITREIIFPASNSLVQ
ncbi:MAG: pseudouridine synthase [Bacteroidia bacterium]|nr:pseudouridine synthase [Bacteroidia bacterium]